MNKTSYFFNLASTFFYIFALVLPNIVLGSDTLSILLLSFFYFFIYSVIKLRVFYILTFPFLSLSLIQVFFYEKIHRSVISPLLIEISLFQSDTKERMSIISDHLFLFILCSIIIVFFWGFTKKTRINKNVKVSLFLASFSMFISLLFTTTESEAYKRKHTDHRYHLKTIVLINVKNIFPFNILRNTWTAYLTNKKASIYFKNTNKFKFDYPETENKKEIILLVIGESSRASSFELNTPILKTNPRLSKRKNLVSFKNAYTPYSSTSRSVPLALSRIALENWKKDIYKEKSIVSAMKELGYETFVIDNQKTNSSLLDFYKTESDTYIQMKNPTSYDYNIIPILDSIVKYNPVKKKFILIHSYGSHYNYKARYPKSMAKFIPDESTNNQIEFKIELNNAYLNTIHYVDFFLDELINTIEPYNSSMLYFSDHGENIYDNDENLIFHGYIIPNKNTLNIPIITWISDNKNKTSPQILDAVNSNSTKTLSTESIFVSVLNLTELDSSYFNINKSIYSKQLKPLDKIQYFDENNILQNLN